MVRQWREFSYRKGTNPIRWIRSYPLFAIAVAMFATIAGVVAWAFITSFAGPEKFVIVEVHEVGSTASANGVTVSIERVTYQPAVRVRLGRSVSIKHNPTVMIDGRFVNDTDQPLAAFLPVEGQHSGAVLTGADGQVSESPVRIIGLRPCPGLATGVVLIEPRSGQRFSVLLPAGRGAPTAWVRKSLQKGSLPGLSLGPFAFGDCEPETGGTGFTDPVWIEFGASDLPVSELHDYYPFGPPTGQEISVNGRKYWSNWLPREE